MLRVKLEVVPFGQEGLASTLTELFIGNDGTGTKEVGHYDVYTSDPRKKPYPRNERDGWIGRIENFNREDGRDALTAKAFALAATTTKD